MNKYIAVLLLVFSGSALADQTAITNFDASKTIFWRDLYPTGGHTLYCDPAFAGHAGLLNSASYGRLTTVKKGS